MGALADYPQAKRKWLNLFAWSSIILTVGLTLVPTNMWKLLLVIFILSIIGYSGGNLFYDSFLTDVADDLQMDMVSSTGYGMGYLGGVIAFIVFLTAQLSNGFVVCYHLMELQSLVFGLPLSGGAFLAGHYCVMDVKDTMFQVLKIRFVTVYDGNFNWKRLGS